MTYPTELITVAKFEISVFDHIALSTALELIAEVEKLRAMLRQLADATDNLAVNPTSVTREDAQALVHDARAML